MVYKFDEYLIESIIENNIEYYHCNEKLDLKGAVDKIKNINITGIFKDIMKNIKNNKLNFKSTINYLLNSVNNTKNKVKKEGLVILLFLLYITNISSSSVPYVKISNIESNIKQSGLFDNLVDKDMITINDLYSIDSNYIQNELGLDPYIRYENLKNYKQLSASDSIQFFIKDKEKLRLDAYNIGDNMITIGYGHAEDIETSRYKEGDTISEKQAERLFKKDLKKAESGVRRMFRDWEKDDIYVDISQGIYDALVSIAFNSGVSGMRSSEMVKQLKNKNYIVAANLVLKTRVKNADKFPGLNTRREKERDFFLQDLTNNNLTYSTGAIDYGHPLI